MSAIVYLIRHGEKPPVGDTLSEQGVTRSEALPQVFGSGSQYNIGYIMAEHPKKGKWDDTLEVIAGLADSLDRWW